MIWFSGGGDDDGKSDIKFYSPAKPMPINHQGQLKRDMSRFSGDQQLEEQKKAIMSHTNTDAFYKHN